MSFVEETRPTPEEDNNLLEIDINSNDVINLQKFDLDSMGDIFYGCNIQSERISNKLWEQEKWWLMNPHGTVVINKDNCRGGILAPYPCFFPLAGQGWGLQGPYIYYTAQLTLWGA